jgi:outer membrane protein
VIIASHNLAVSVGRMTARDLNLPVEFYDMEAYYRAVRNRWVGWGDLSAERVSADRLN